MNKIITCLLLSLCSQVIFAQSALIKGTIIHEDTKLPYNEVTVTLPLAKITTSTDANGEFTFSSIPFGTYELVMSADGVTEERINISVNAESTILEPYELKTVLLNANNYAVENSGANIEDASSQDENSVSSAGQNVASVLNASRDAYLSAATFGWGQYFYKMRGYENDQNVLYLNGVPMNDLEEGGIFFNSFSGLNDVFRGRSIGLGLAPNESAFGGLGLNTTLDASASNQRKGTRLTYTATNRSYRNRMMITHSSGLKKNGWAYSFSFSRRWAQQGQIKGTFYDAYGYFAAIEKRFKKQGISLTIVGAPIQRGKAGPATKEAFELAGTNYYNPYWGYQNGEIRNTRVLNSHMPMAILSHDIKLSTKTILNSAISYQTGEVSTTGIDWYNAADPRPDYYRYMPSYQDSLSLTNELSQIIKGNPDKYLQVNWDAMYEANRLNKLAGYRRSVYMVNENVETSKKLNGAVNLESTLSDHITIYSGIAYQRQNNHDFQRVKDLMGGDYWVNTNQFAEDGIQGQTVSTSLNVGEADSIRKEGDIYGYDYNIHFQKASWFAQGVFTYNKFDFFLAGELGYTGFYRTGNYKHGLYQDSSKGDSRKLNFSTYRVKGGFTYKLNGRNYIYVNGAMGTKAPFVDNILVSARTRNQMVTNPRVEEFQSAELGYLLRTPFIKARLTFYATDIKNAVDIKRYYDDQGASFTNNVLQNLNKRYTGIEFGAEVKVSPSLSATLAGAFSQAYYTDRATSILYSDNDIALGNTANAVEQTVYLKNYYVPAGPQSSFQLGLNYRAKKFWFATISFNYLANNWMDFAPSRRTLEGVDLLAYNSTEWSAVIDQQKLPSVFTVDIFGGKSFKVDKYIKKASSNTFLNLNLGLTNLLNNKNIMLYGFENLRVGSATAQPDWFVPKYAHALGIQYFINLTLRF
ncbi:MAG: carboxypeptidase-like regulatory domain-containing protein [Chitinophagaceae bacterium]|nr:carboxypeptidase-like regulatory domain-containing protein [Chitinophagaceae bacterium]